MSVASSLKLKEKPTSFTERENFVERVSHVEIIIFIAKSIIFIGGLILRHPCFYGKRRIQTAHCKANFVLEMANLRVPEGQYTQTIYGMVRSSKLSCIESTRAILIALLYYLSMLLVCVLVLRSRSIAMVK